MTIKTENTYCDNGCRNHGHLVCGNVAESITSVYLKENIKHIVDKYKGHDYQIGYCEMIHISDFGNFHVCVGCIRTYAQKHNHGNP